jgi:S1-C subfamily serine protease
MHSHRFWPLIFAGALAIMLAGCSGVDTRSLLSEPTSVALPRASIPAPTAVAVVAPAETRPTGVVETPAAQQATAIPQAAQDQLDAEEQVVANVYDRVAPAVTRIETAQGLGSGYLIDKDGHIVTNNHVIADSQNGQVLVSFSGLFQTVGTVVGADPDSDIAVVKVDELPEKVTPVELGDSKQVRVGQRTIAIGNPLGQDRTVTTGIVSAIGRTIDESGASQQNQQGQPGPSYSIGGAIQTDAAINPGNSGGPLLDSRGRVIGMNTIILSQSGTNSGIGFAVPVDLIKKVATALIQSGKYAHPWLGVSLGTVTTYQAKRQNLPSAGIMLEPDPNTGDASPVYQAGLHERAIMTAINGTAVTSVDDVISYLEINTNPGDTVKLTIVGANGQQQELAVKLGARPSVQDRQQQP